jgi:hypothetical protein
VGCGVWGVGRGVLGVGLGVLGFEFWVRDWGSGDKGRGWVIRVWNLGIWVRI